MSSGTGERTPTRRPVITGIGALAPTGIGAAALWRAACRGRRAIAPLTRYDPRGTPLALAGQIEDFEPHDHLPGAFVAQTDRFTQLALAAARMALDDARLDPAALPPYGVGVVTAACAGGVEFGQREIQRLWSRGPSYVGPYQSIAWFYAASTGQISIRHGLKGPSGVLVTDEAGGLDAVAHAAREIGRGAHAMLAGGAEAPLSPFSMACQYGHGLLTRATDPDRGYLPLTGSASGFVPAEGGAMVVLEAHDEALARGARPRAAVLGHGQTFTGARRFERSAEGLAVAARTALAAAGRTVHEVDAVFADALGTPDADRAEAAALRLLFGDTPVPVTAPKAGYGRAYAGAAALDVALAALSLDHGTLPATPCPHDPLPGIDLVTGRPRALHPRTVLLLARGLSGGNSALVLGRTDPDSQEEP
ncbi:beta-ketoacyl synthase N-terminal-like domain-containing protein [Streptomyces niveiscabiei]|uniref:beta-ketoacyl synthase N-terminal-like domain-containing protein n=1 Tax=Streptomyces niveiscabiei TaxID=164115 RepID=UPI0029A66AC1|nr:beta-ketoacyl synthase N-terminal-like domain-containing protein [Streptomyces niveiscabiei]MDX3386244.1 beta-ketoacyl synthase N-terminal-like domain-containing protein [Streptomyces niveiscabiei]